MPATRPTLQGTRHAISSGHYLASAAGFAVLEAGGNAIDAGCAAGLALSVLQPDIVSFGGVAPIVLQTASGHSETISGLGHWPRSIPADLFMREHAGTIPEGVLRTVVPAAPDAWLRALSRHGTMDFASVAHWALRYATEGFAVHDYLAHSAHSRADQFARWPENAALFLPGGVPLQLGDRLVQNDLASTINYMVDAERHVGGDRRTGIAAARDAFYKGDIAHRIVAHQAAEGGYLSLDDMARFTSAVEAPVTVNWRGHKLMTGGPWCQGPVLLESLLILEHLGFADLTHNSPTYLHQLTEALKLAFADREHFYGDPDFVDVPLEALLSAESIVTRAALISPDHAHPGMPEPAHLPEPSATALPTVDADTSYVAVVDRWGNAFSATPSDVAFSAPMVPGLGFVPSARGNQSRPDPRHPAGVAPGKRPRLTPAPALLAMADGSVMPFGTPGADVQVQAMLQVLLNVVHFGMPLQDAIEAPRIASYSFPSSSAPYEYRPGKLAIEARIDPATCEALAAMGHKVEMWPDWTRQSGSVEVVLADRSTGLISAGADPRRPAYAIAG